MEETFEHLSIDGAVEAASRSAILEVRANSKLGHGLHEYTTYSRVACDNSLKTANCVEFDIGNE